MNIRQLLVAGVMLLGANQLNASEAVIKKLLAHQANGTISYEEKVQLALLQQKELALKKAKVQKQRRAASFNKRS